ncbi:MAG: polysaccharide deacetylase family protein [Deltaproteobacteria bacterium]
MALNNIPILLYHAVHADASRPRDNFSVAESEFHKQIAYLHHNGFLGVSLSKFLGEMGQDQARVDTRKRVVLTFDDGDASHFAAAAPVLKESGFTATFFITVNDIGKVGRMSWEQIYELSRAGMDVGSHAMNHVFLPSMTSYNLLNDLLLSKQVLEKYIRRRVEFLSIPHGFYNKTILGIARDVGFKAACVSDAGYNDFLDDDVFCLQRFTMRLGYGLDAFKSIVSGTPQLNVVAAENLRTFLRKTLGYQLYDRVRRLRAK